MRAHAITSPGNQGARTTDIWEVGQILPHLSEGAGTETSCHIPLKEVTLNIIRLQLIQFRNITYIYLYKLVRLIPAYQFTSKKNAQYSHKP